MRIVHIAPFYNPVVGGVEEVVRRIVEYMAGRGHEVYVVTYNKLRKGGKGRCSVTARLLIVFQDQLH